MLEAAFNEIHRNGFRSASIDAILRETGVTKGALYYHFRSKAELGYAVVDEIVRPFVEDNWKPVCAAENIIDAAIAVLHARIEERSGMALTLGCPFNNLIQEMSGVDAGFRERLHNILEDWRQGVAQAIKRGQDTGQIRDDIDPQGTADFMISGIEGCIGMAKGAADAGLKPAVGVIGDSTFLHSGVTPLMDAASHDTDMVVLILDNETVAMTGGQPTVLRTSRLKPVVLGVGCDPDHVHEVHAKPKNVGETAELIKRELEHPGLSVIIIIRECVQTARQKKAEKAKEKRS